MWDIAATPVAGALVARYEETVVLMAIQDFQRARAPEQVEQRRVALLDAAAALLDEGGLAAVTLSAIARRAGLAKSNVYRYFEGREEILLQLLLVDEAAWVEELEAALAPLAGSNDPDRVAGAIAETLLAHPTLCELVAVVANVLEQNVSVDAVVRFKTRVLQLSIRLMNALLAAMPGLSHERAPALLRYLQALVAGLYPIANPSPTAAKATACEQFETLRSDFKTDLTGALATMLRGALRA